MINNIIQLLYYSLFLFTPLIMTSITSELFEFNKMIFIYLVTALIVFFWVLKMIFSKKIILKKTVFDIPIIIFLASQILSTIFSIDRHTSFFGYYGRFNGGLFSIITYIILFYGGVSNLDRDTVIKLLKASLLGSLIVIIWGLPGKFGYDLSCFLFMGQLNNSCWTDQFHPETRMFSTLGQPNWLGAYLAINFFIGLYFLFKETNNKKTTFFYLLYLFLNSSAILFTRSRSSLVSLVVSLGIYSLFFKNNLKKFFLILILLLVPVFLFKTGINQIDRYLNFQNKTNQRTINPSSPTAQSSVTESFDIRKIVWKGAIDLGLKYPLFGSGVETFAYSYYFVRPISHNLTSEWDYLYNKAHNEYLNYLATTGFVGLGAYLLMIGFSGFIIVKSIAKDKLLSISLFLAYLSILVTNFFGFSTTTVNLFFYLIPGFIIIVNSKAIKQSDNKFSLSASSASQKLSLLFLSFSIFYLLFSIFKYWYADVTYARADNYTKVADYQSAANLLNRALQLKYEHIYEDKLSYILANLAVLASYQKQPDLVKKLISAANSYNEKSITSSSKNVLYWKTRAKNQYLFYQITLDSNQIKNGITTLSEARSLSPTDPKIPYSLAIFYSLMFDETKDKYEKSNFQKLSLQAVEETINLKLNYRDGYFLKGQLLKKYGKKDEARKTFQFILDKIFPNDEETKKEFESLSRTGI